MEHDIKGLAEEKSIAAEQRGLGEMKARNLFPEAARRGPAFFREEADSAAETHPSKVRVDDVDSSRMTGPDFLRAAVVPRQPFVLIAQCPWQELAGVGQHPDGNALLECTSDQSRGANLVAHAGSGDSVRADHDSGRAPDEFGNGRVGHKHCRDACGPQFTCHAAAFVVGPPFGTQHPVNPGARSDERADDGAAVGVCEQHTSLASRERAFEPARDGRRTGFNGHKKAPEMCRQQACAFTVGGAKTFESDTDDRGHGGLSLKDGSRQLAKVA